MDNDSFDSKKNEKYYDLRIDYQQKPLLESETSDDPRDLFTTWFDEALKGGEVEPNGMTFSTINSEIPQKEKVRSRIVLLKETTPEGFIFYTGLGSSKGREMQSRPLGAINFWWRELHRQVRIEGSLSYVSREKNQQYFESRPRASQLAVLTQKQGERIPSRDELLNKYKEMEAKFKNQSQLICPMDWGGICLKPNYFEFWQGQPNRLHDRICYELIENGTWSKYRLSP